MIFKKILNLNFLLIFVILILIIIGTAALYSAGEGSFSPWAEKHIIRFGVLFFLMIIIALIDIKFIFKYSYPLFFLCLILLFSVEIIGTFGKGAERWIRIFGISVQPSEIIKVAIILALAKYFHNLRFDTIGKIYHIIIPAFFILVPFVLVLLQPDLGTAISIFLLGVMTLFIAGIRIWKFVLGVIISLGSFPFLWDLIKPYQQKRFLSFLNPELDPLGQGYQLIQSKIALGSGGLTGKGFLEGTQSYLEYLPEKQTDFIFTLIGEEFGFIGTMFILFLFGLLITICFYISIKSYHIFGRIICLGVACNIFIYVILNMAMVTGLMPVVGIPLPLISYGGTAMLSIMVSFGLLLNVGIYYNVKKINQ